MNVGLLAFLHRQKPFFPHHQNFTYVTIRTAPNCNGLATGCTLQPGMEAKLTDKLSILRTSDHFRDWHTLDDERICVLCDRKFNGHDVHVSTVGDEFELHCPTTNCKSSVHQWVYPGNPLLDENNEKDWWRALGSMDEPDRADSASSPQPI